MIEFSVTKDEAKTVLIAVHLARQMASEETTQKLEDVYKILISQFVNQSEP